MSHVTLAPNQALSIIENFEGLGSAPFYVLQGDVNFGYGYDLTKNSSTASPMLSGFGIPSNAISAALSGNVTAANGDLSSLTQSQIGGAEQNVASSYLDNTVMPTLGG
jgi:hypothetical protein